MPEDAIRGYASYFKKFVAKMTLVELTKRVVDRAMSELEDEIKAEFTKN